MTSRLRRSASPDSSYEDSWQTDGPRLFDSTLRFLQRHYLAIAICAALGLSAGVALLRVVPPTYTADVKVLLGPSRTPVIQPQAVTDETPIDIESQIEILKSKAIATSVINQLPLATDPEFMGEDRGLRSLMKTVREMLGQSVEGTRFDAIVDEFQARTSAYRVGMSSVINISFSDSNPERAATIANAIVTAYFDEKLKAKTVEHRVTTTWLHDRLQELGNDALNAERKVNELRTASNIVSADGKLIDEQQVSALNNHVVLARARTSDAMTRLNRFESILASKNFDAASLGNIDPIPDRTATARDNTPNSQVKSTSSPNNTQIINTLRQQYLDLSSKEYEYTAKYGSSHLAVVNLRTQMKSVQQTMLDEIRRLAESARSDFEEAKQQQQATEKQLADAISHSRSTTTSELSIRELEISAKGYRSLYESFLQRYIGSIQQSSFPVTEARVISSATPPQKKSKPSPKFLLAFGLFAGTMLGAAIGFVRELKDRGFRTSEQIEDRLRLPCLSVVPLLKNQKLAKLIPARAASTDQVGKESTTQKIVFGSSPAAWLATGMPQSRFAESIRSIRLAVDPGPTKSRVAKIRSKVVGLTSALPDEGKSTIAASLAHLLANSGKRVIVIDCDLRNPSLSATLAPDASAGIADIISGDRSLEDTIWTDPVTTLDFLPARGAHLRSASDVLCDQEMKVLFDRLRLTYDYVIVDLPPLAPVADARAIAGLLDKFILVVEWGRTSAALVEHALDGAPGVGDALLGVVLNKTDMKAMKRYATNYGDYYSHKYYGRYGEVTAE
jgi:exopolysaccharide transport family protein